ncbi:MAG: hypothetical protein DYH05_14385 [Acidobacteria bacterium ACB1]|nr:hypothetical protein [Acidobacteria bacterium ACB1]
MVEQLVDLDDQKRKTSQPRKIVILQKDVQELPGRLLPVDSLVQSPLKVKHRFVQLEQKVPTLF